ncbi:WYL domain-containing protein [Diaphorobacter nitroreducens]|uniref:WYL domain-containing protein n=1 Tax=Diaphorobacter nitroreducens TaxID=164759 RepID=UPI0028A1F04A|nr:WYL domain-containing protein [Diaphorobacter nitroreducens]
MALEASTSPPDHWSYPSMKERVEAEGAPLKEHFCFHYQDSDGERTIRTVRSTHVLFSYSDVYILGHCELRNEKRVFRASRITQAYLLSGGARLFDFSTWVRNKTPVHRAVPSKQAPLVRETGAGYMAVQTSRGLVHMSSTIYSEVFGESSTLSESEAAATLLDRLPALAPDLATEMSQKLSARKANL